MKTTFVLLCLLSMATLSQAEISLGQKGWLNSPAGGPVESRKSGDPEEIRVRTTIFKAKGRELPMSLLEHPTVRDEVLFQRLAAMVADGRAELVADQHFSAPQGRELRIEAMKEFPYPTEYERRGMEMLPVSGEFRAIGTSLVAELYAGGQPGASDPSTGTSGRLILDNIRGDQRGRVPVSLPDSPVDGVLLCARFFTEKSSMAWSSPDQDHHLVSLFRAAETLQSADEAYCFVFARTSLASGAKPEAGPPADWRLHALTFRLPRDEGRALLSDPENRSDAALLDSLLASAAAGGTARPHHHAILRIDAGRRLTTREPGGERDPFATSPASGTGEERAVPLGSKAESMEEYAYPTESDPDLTPQSFDYRTLGRSFAATVVEASKAGTAVVEIRLQEHSRVGTRRWPEPDDVNRAFVARPQFAETAFEGTVRIAAGGVVCLGAVALPEEMTGPGGSGPEMEIAFLKAVAGHAPDKTLSPPLRTEYEWFSLTADGAAALQRVRGDFGRAEALLTEALEAGTAHSMSWVMLAAEEETGKGSIKAIVEHDFPTSAEWSPRGWLRPLSFGSHFCGPSLTILPEGGAAGPRPPVSPVDKTRPGENEKLMTGMEFKQDVLLRPLPDTAALTAAANLGGKGDTLNVPAASLVGRTPPPLPGDGRIVSIGEFYPLPGIPEDQCWLVQVIRRR